MEGNFLCESSKATFAVHPIPNQTGSFSQNFGPANRLGFTCLFGTLLVVMRFILCVIIGPVKQVICHW